MVNAKTERWAQALIDSLSAILPAKTGSAYVVGKVYGVDSTVYNGDVYVTITLSTGNNSVKAAVRLRPATAPASGSKDSLGLPQTVYTPHVAEVLFDLTTPNSVGASEAVQRIVDREVSALGTRVEWFKDEYSASVMNVAAASIAATFAAADAVVALDNIDTRNGSLSNL